MSWRLAHPGQEGGGLVVGLVAGRRL